MTTIHRTILRALVELGGSGTVGDIRARMGVTGYTVFDKRPALEYEGLITTREVERAIDAGTMHGTVTVTEWRITDAGRAALQERSAAV